MLQFILGRAGSGKTEYIRRMLADHSLAGKGGCVLLVPEQYSFETEKAMLRLPGPSGPTPCRSTASPAWRRPCSAGGGRGGPPAQRRGPAHPHVLGGGRLRGAPGGLRQRRQKRPRHRRDAHRRQRDENVRHRPRGPVLHRRPAGGAGPGPQAAGALPHLRDLRLPGGGLLLGLPGRPDPPGGGPGAQRLLRGLHRGGGLLRGL